ncbi:SIR2 family protein [Nonomuraea angiospora]|uniref:SIR2 family NAD-dependent protein deacylase n=1 Tax=Nonomuraea angiospora TaxID=46172 RepID=UPI00344B3335
MVLPVGWRVNEADWVRLVRQLRRGDCTPLLGAGACYGRLPTGKELSKHFAKEYGFPFADHGNLAHVMQYAAHVHNDPTDLKVEVCAYLKQYAAGATDPLDPHTVLAEFPIKTFLTTNYDDFMLQALQHCRKGPRTPNVCRSTWWEPTNRAVVPDPDPDHPLIYHLHGNWDDPSSIVLTENDYVQYLLNLRDVDDANGRQLLPIPEPVLDAMTSSPLLFLGYSLQDWNFRVLFHGLIKSIPSTRQRRHISVQLLPELNASLTDAENLAAEYLKSYYADLKISIYVGTTSAFFKELLDWNARTPL